MESKELSKKYKDYVINLRREFHKYPELSWQEFRTSERIKEELAKLNIPFVSIAKTGVVATIKGNKEGKVVGLRADMDALEVNEANDVSYKSVNEGVMHACGHDGHVAMLLGAAKILNEMKNEIKGSVKLFFQPAEEDIGGAEIMIKEGCMEKVNNVLAIHLWSELSTGKVSVQKGPRMAATGKFKIKVKGVSGHGSLPNQGIDALVAASSIVMDLQSIVSREISPLESAVVSVGTFNSGTRYNVIAGEAVLEGTTRCFNNEIRNEFPKIMKRIVDNTSNSYRVKAELEYTKGAPPTINDPKSSQLAANTVEKILGPEGNTQFQKTTGGEDFAYFLEKAPGLLAFVGARNEEKSCTYAHHHERFNIDEDALEIGTTLYVQYAIDFLRC